MKDMKGKTTGMKHYLPHWFDMTLSMKACNKQINIVNEQFTFGIVKFKLICECEVSILSEMSSPSKSSMQCKQLLKILFKFTYKSYLLYIYGIELI